MGLSINTGFQSTRLLSGVNLNHIEAASMTYLGKYGPDLTASLRNLSTGTLVAPVESYQPANMVFGSNYMTSSGDSLSAGVQSTGQVQQLPTTIFASFNCAALPGTAEIYRDLVAMWGTNPNTNTNPGYAAIGLLQTAAGKRYVVFRWGTNTQNPVLTCAVEFDWVTVTTPVMAIGSRDAAGNMKLEVRGGGNTQKASALVTPVVIPSTTTEWRLFVGQISSRPISGLKMHAAASWQKYLTEDQLSAELDVMKVNLVGWV